MCVEQVVDAYLSLGSNCANAAEMLHNAIIRLAKVGEIFAQSPRYSTEPQDDPDQPWFINQVIGLRVDKCWQPQSLLGACLEIENALGRKRLSWRRYGPRTMDIDLLLFGACEIADENCTVPHPRMCRRAFVLCPLLDIAPDIVIHGRKAREWLSGLNYRREGGRIWQAGLAKE